jgi:hypothetical protein
LLLLLRFPMNLPRQTADPEGVAHGCATFFYEAGCRLEKSLRQRIARLALYGEAFFFASVSFDAYQKK